MNNKSYLTTNPELYRRVTDTVINRSVQLPELNVEEMAATLIEDQKQKIKELEIQIKAYEIQIEGEKKNTVDHGPYIQAVERQINQIRNQEAYINQQICNCQMVEGQVTPMEYYLWKKKQRINTYDASIAELCKQMETEREELQKGVEQLKVESQEIIAEIEKLQQRLSQINSSGTDPFIPTRKISQDSDSLQDLFAKNVNLKEQYANLSSTREFLQENKDIVGMQINDNIRSIESSLKAYFQNEKIKLVKEFKQIQADSKSLEISPLNNEEQNYKIDPLLADYTFKLKELFLAAPENMKKVVVSIVQPMSWDKFYWKDFLEVQPKSQQIYAEYRNLEAEYMQNEAQTEKLQQQIKEISQQLATEQMRSSELSENIRKLRKKLKK